MERRDAIRVLGSAVALALAPRDALAAWARVASGLRPASGLTSGQLAFINAIADTIIPRTDTPGAADVDVAAFVDVIVSENYDEAERGRFEGGLDAFDADVKAAGGVAFVDLDTESRGAAIGRVEALADRRVEPARTYWRLKSLIVHGYFTSERVMQDVLQVQVTPGAFDGAAPMPVRKAPPGAPEVDIPPRSGAENAPPRSGAENGPAAQPRPRTFLE